MPGERGRGREREGDRVDDGSERRREILCAYISGWRGMLRPLLISSNRPTTVFMIMMEGGWPRNAHFLMIRNKNEKKTLEKTWILRLDAGFKQPFDITQEPDVMLTFGWTEAM